jgi:DNA primase
MTGQGRISSAAVERVREAADIVSIIGRHVHLARAGRSMKGLCPFHREKTPSFNVSQERQTFHCFGCGAGGDVFTFLMTYLGIPFPEAVEELAQEYGIDISRDSAPDPSDSIRRVLAEAQDFFTAAFSGGDRAAASYLETRGISQATAAQLGIGWAAGGNSLSRTLEARGFQRSSLIEAGVSMRSDDGRTVFDRFRERLTFPIRDRRGRVVSFGARTLGDAVPKYLNGPDSPVYSKGDLLYGFSDARLAAREADTVILVEGYFDHARLVESGFQFTVATCGTALTPSQARTLGSMASGVVICYDGDQAGQRASMRAVEILLAQRCYPGVLSLEAGMDPDDFVRRRGVESFVEKLDTPLDPVAFALELAGGWEALKKRGRAVAALRRLARLASIPPDPIIRETLIGRISELTGYTEPAVGSQVAESVEEAPHQNQPGRPETPAAENTMLRAAMSGDGKLDTGLLELLSEDDFSPGVARDLLVELRRLAADGHSMAIPGLMPPGPASLCATLLEEQGGFDAGDIERIRGRINRTRTDRRRAELSAELAGAGPEDRRRILREIAILDCGARRNGG